MKVILEEALNVTYLTEGTDADKKHFIQGIFMQSELQNKNGRIYPKHVLDREVDRYNKNYVNQNRAYGELGHPDGPGINLDKVSHMIRKLYPDGNNYIGKAEILNTPNGKIVKSLLEAGANLGVSCRGVGSLKPQNGYQLVQDDYYLATAADIVADPSAPNAFVQGIMEGHEWQFLNTGWKEIDYEKAKKELKEASKYDLEDKMLKVFANFMSKL